MKASFFGPPKYKECRLHPYKIWIRYRKMTRKNTKSPVKKKLSDLEASLIEEGKIQLDVQVIGKQLQKALPKIIEAKCARCNNRVEFDIFKETDINFVKNLVFTNVYHMPRYLQGIVESEFGKAHGFECCDGKRHFIGQSVREYIDFSILYSRDFLDGKMRYDPDGYVEKPVYLIGEKPPYFTKKVRFIGDVVVDPKKRDIVIIANSVSELENEIINFEITEKDTKDFLIFQKDDNDDYEQVAPHIVGERRRIAKEWVLNTLHSPAIIPDIDGITIRGSLNICFFGDSTTGKSETAKYYTDKGKSKKIHVGEYIDIETSSRSGILYTINMERDTLILGALPLNDLGFCVLDGYNQMHREEVGELRETLRNQELKVDRFKHHRSPVRVRLISCLNPGKKRTKTMREYRYPCMAIPDTWVFSNPQDIARWDLFIPFLSGDVSSEEIVEREYSKEPIPENILLRKILWAWSRKPDDIIYTEKAVEAIKEETKKLMVEYAISSIPIVNDGIRDVVCRISTAYASRKYSTDETHEKIVVRERYVREAVKSYREVLDILELREFKLQEEGRLDIGEDEFARILMDLGDIEYKILDKLQVRSSSSSELASEFDVSERTIKEHYKPLKRHGLIKAVTGVGIDLTSRGVIFLRGLGGHSAMVKENFTNENDGEGKLHHCTKGGSKGGIKLSNGTNPEEDPRSIATKDILTDEAIRRFLKGRITLGHTDFAQFQNPSAVIKQLEEEGHIKADGNIWKVQMKTKNEKQKKDYVDDCSD